MFGVPPALLGVLKQLGSYQQLAFQRALTNAAHGAVTDPDQLGAWLANEMKDWNPTLKGRRLSDDATKKAAARFLAGVACNFAHPEKDNT